MWIILISLILLKQHKRRLTQKRAANYYSGKATPTATAARRGITQKKEQILFNNNFSLRPGKSGN